MRFLGLLLTALLACAAATLVAVGLLSVAPGLPPIVGGFAAVVAATVTGILGMVVFNRGPKQGKTLSEQIDELRTAGMLVSEPFTARRAFMVEEFEDEGIHYFVELEDGSVLFLSGQYLYDSEERFPCTQFVVWRHRDQRYAVELECAGEVLEPEAVAPPFTEEEYASDRVPEDGRIMTDRTYDDLEREWTSRG